MQKQVTNKAINKLIYISLFVLILCLILAVSKYIGLSSFLLKILKTLTPVFIAIFISFVLEPIISFFSKKGLKRMCSVFLTYGLIIIIFGLLIYFTIPSLTKQVEIFINKIPSLISVVQSFFSKLGFNFDDDKTNEAISNFILNLINNMARYLGSSISVIFNVLLGVSGAIFLSFDFPEFKKAIKERIPSKIKEPLLYYLKHFLPFINKYFYAILLDSILIFLISYIGFIVVGIDYPLVISIIIAITNLIPIIGPYVGGVPAAIVGFSISPTLGISAIIVVVIVQIIESNFMQPLILKNVISLHPLEGILGISLFGYLFGIMGMILSPIIMVGIKLLFIPYKKEQTI